MDLKLNMFAEKPTILYIREMKISSILGISSDITCGEWELYQSNICKDYNLIFLKLY